MADSTSRTKLTLESDTLVLTLLPDLGGSVGNLTYRGIDVLRPFDEAGVESPLHTGGFPLFPFSGRISNARFDWNGRTVSLTPNFLPEPHAIHGQSWLDRWQVVDSGPETACLEFKYAPSDWPWAYRAEQAFRVTANRLDLIMTLTNTGNEDMPAGLGWHPYFPRGDARFSVPVDRMWTADSGMIPDRLSCPPPAADLTGWQSVNETDLDNAFTVSSCVSRIEWPARKIAVDLESDSLLGHVVVYTPPGEDFFCVEPVSHAPDAVNSRHSRELTGLHTLAPGESLSAKITLTVRELFGR